MRLGSLLALVMTGTMLAACVDTLDMVGNETSASANKLRDIAGLGRKQAPSSSPQSRYCYKTFEDVICYPKPLASSQDYRMVGYQTSEGKVGYILSDSDVTNAEEAKERAQLLPLKAVTVNSPPNVKADDKQLKEIIFDPAELEPKQLVPEKMQ